MLTIYNVIFNFTAIRNDCRNNATKEVAKFLLLYRGFNECFVQGVDDGKSANLKANILNLIQFLPQEVGNQCKKDINYCKEDRNKPNDTTWDLHSQIVITL